jgi:hypothetical protein
MSTSKVQSPPTRRGNKLVLWLGRGLLGVLALIIQARRPEGDT